MLHAVPFHDSASVRVVLVVLKVPTALQEVADGHETPLSAALVAPVGFGVAWMLQAVPFQDSARVEVTLVLLEEDPTASQSVAETHDTADRFVNVAPVGVGMVWMLHAVPFHVSARGVEAPVLVA